MFMELYYNHYKEDCRSCYWREEKSLPYSILIHDKERRLELEKLLLDHGFTCVVHENEYPLMYVNMNLRRFGRNVKACSSAAINATPMTLEQFMTEILLPYLEDRKHT